MSFKVNINHNFHDLQEMMDDLSNQQIGAATRTAINRALTKGRVQVVKQLKRDINLKSSSIKKRIKIVRVKTGSLHNMSGAMIFSGIPISMMEFVVGNKGKIEQKGVKVRKRRKLKARIAPGKTFHVKGGFIQDIKSKQVFRGKGKGRRVRKLSTASIAVMAFRRPRIDRVLKTIEAQFEKELNNQIRWRFSRLSSKYSKSPMRLPR